MSTKMFWLGIRRRAHWRNPGVPFFFAWRYTHGRCLGLGPIMFDLRRRRRSS